jgi:hypothetical protein
MKTPFPFLRELAPGALAMMLAGVPASAQEVSAPWSMTVYLQQSWPKQTETNRQIKEDINGSLGTHFNTWEDVTNLNLGILVYRTLAPGWRIGLEVDYSQGRIHGRDAVNDFGAGPGTVSFEQKYSLYADAVAMVQFRPLGDHGRWIPFLSAGAGFAYEKDSTTLGFASSIGAGDFELLKVDNDGWFPMFTAGVGVDVYFTEKRTWYAELGVSYSWARLKHITPATGLLAPAPTVTADTDSTGPNIWLGVGRRF